MKDVTPHKIQGSLAYEIEQYPQTWYRDELIQAVIRGSYHEIHSCRTNPRSDLVKRLCGLSYMELAKRVHAGEFAETPCRRSTCEKCDEIYAGFDAYQTKNP